MMRENLRPNEFVGGYARETGNLMIRVTTTEKVKEDWDINPQKLRVTDKVHFLRVQRVGDYKTKITITTSDPYESPVEKEQWISQKGKEQLVDMTYIQLKSAIEYNTATVTVTIYDDTGAAIYRQSGKEQALEIRVYSLGTVVVFTYTDDDLYLRVKHNIEEAYNRVAKNAEIDEDHKCLPTPYDLAMEMAFGEPQNNPANFTRWVDRLKKHEKEKAIKELVRATTEILDLYGLPYWY